MRAQREISRSFEFYFPELDNYVLVENRPEKVIIRATRDNFSDRRKFMFIRYLAAEGHIPDHFAWLCQIGADEMMGMRWVIDRSWLRLSPEIRRRATRNALRFLFVSCLVWLVMMAILFLNTH